MFEKILDEIKKYGKIIIHRHSNPDGDALGAQIGLYEIIRTNFPEKTVYKVGDGARRYSFMDGSTMDEISDAEYEGALAIILDTSAKALISDDRYTLASCTARIDHHIFCEQIADVEVTDTSFESCAGMIAEFAKESELVLTVAAAKALYTGMTTDSGRFRYDSTTSRTFALASFLTEKEFDITEIYRELYSDDYERMKLRAQFVLKIKFTDKKVAYIYTTAEEALATGADTFTVSRGMVGTMADIRGVDIWVNFTETESGVLCEIRSSKYNINPIATKYGGGGHAKASGATLADREEAMRLLADLDAMIEE
jgi:phosphoesterase RecJ-like protein